MTPTEFAKLMRVLRFLVNSTEENHEAVQLILELINEHSVVPAKEALSRGQGPQPGAQEPPRGWSGRNPARNSTDSLSPPVFPPGGQGGIPCQNRPAVVPLGVPYQISPVPVAPGIGSHSPWSSYNAPGTGSPCASSQPPGTSTPVSSSSSSDGSLIWVVCPHCNRPINMETNLRVEDSPRSDGQSPDRNVRFRLTVVPDSRNSSRISGQGQGSNNNCSGSG